MPVYLAILDVYYAAGARQEVHCELAWSSDFKNWHRIEEGHDLIPLGGEGSFERYDFLFFGDASVLCSTASQLPCFAPLLTLPILLRHLRVQPHLLRISAHRGPFRRYSRVLFWR